MKKINNPDHLSLCEVRLDKTMLETVWLVINDRSDTDRLDKVRLDKFRLIQVRLG